LHPSRIDEEFIQKKRATPRMLLDEQSQKLVGSLVLNDSGYGTRLGILGGQHEGNDETV
jgi:hypothetical protein